MIRRVAVALAGLLAVVSLQAVAVVRDLEDVEASLLAAREAAVQLDVEVVGDGVDRAMAAAVRADRRVRSPLVAGLRAFGWAAEVDAAERLVNAAAAAADLAQQLEGALHAAPWFATGAMPLVGGAVDTESLRAVADALAAIDAARLLAARQRLSAIPANLPFGLEEATEDAIDGLDRVLQSVELARTGVSLALDLLGDERPTTILVAGQNPAELRGTGGILGQFIEVTINNGAFTVGEGVTHRSDVDDRRHLGDPVERSTEFATRYDAAAAGELLLNVNMDPDLPTVGPVLVRQYERLTGVAVDHVVLIDPIALQRLARGLGPIEIRDAEAGLPSRLRPVDVARGLLVDAYVAGARPDARRRWQAEVARAILDEILTGSPDPSGLAQGLGAALATRHVQVFSVHPETQAAIEKLGIAGSLRFDRAVDTVAISANNLTANKADVHAPTDVRVAVVFDVHDGRWTRNLSITTVMHNRLSSTAGLDPAVAVSRRTTLAGRRVVEQERNVIRSAWTTWLAPTDTVTSITDQAGVAVAAAVMDMAGRRAVDHVLHASAGGSAGWTVEASGPAPVVPGGTKTAWELRWRAQPRATADTVVIDVTAPTGWMIAEVDLSRPVGMPTVSGFVLRAPLVVAQSGRHIAMEASATNDISLRILFAPEA